MTGDNGNDQLLGEAGKDRLDVGRGDDHLLGGSSADTLVGGKGNDVLDGGTGGDSMMGGAGDDTYYVQNNGDKTIEAANDGIDTIHASMSWTLADNIERLVLDGTGNINGSGNAGNNAITGNKGANIIAGGAGQDLLTGGGGKDSFIFAAGDAGRIENIGDRITDWASGDHLGLHLSDAKAGGGDNAFTWLSTGAFTHHAGELRAYQSGGNTFVEGDVDGDGWRDFKIGLDGLHDLSPCLLWRLSRRPRRIEAFGRRVILMAHAIMLIRIPVQGQRLPSSIPSVRGRGCAGNERGSSP